MTIRIPLIRPYITERVKEKVCEVLESRYLTEGPVTHEFEEAFKRYIGCRHATAVTSCTTGLELALRAVGVGPGDEVIVPDYTYPATADVVAIVGATTIIVDISRETMLIDYDALEKAITPRTKAIMPVSLFGNPLDYERLGEIRDRYGVYVVEDAACALGAEYRDTRVGNQADIGVFSLHPRKFITTGEGGMIVTNNEAWAAFMDSYKHFGMGNSAGPRRSISFDRIGTNYKLSNLLAAVGLIQMEEIDTLLARRVALAENYSRLLAAHSEFILPVTTPYGRHSYQSYCVFVENRDDVMERMLAAGIEVQIGSYSLHMHAAFAENGQLRIAGDMRESSWTFDHCLTLPLYHEMTQDEQEHVVNELLKSASGTSLITRH